MATENTITGVQLDFDKILNDEWVIYITQGNYLSFNQLRVVSPGIINLKDSYHNFQELIKYDVFYNPSNNQYNISESKDETNNFCNSAVHLGSFVIQGCRVKWMYPENDCITYQRGFQPDFSAGFRTKISKDCEVGCQSFNIDFSTEFNTELNDCNLTFCDNSIGGADGTAFNVQGYLLPECVVCCINK